MPEKILIVDDDVDTLRLVGLMLQKQGYQIVAASNGQQGLELALAELPSLILLDVMMPLMDGYEVARRLRADERTASTPILMFTAKSQLDDKVTGFEAGADEYLTKPTHPTELQMKVKALLARSNRGKAINPPTAPAPEQPGYLIGVTTLRGGLGASTVALNLSATLEKKFPAEVILAEFRPGLAIFTTHLNLPATGGLSSLLGLPMPEITRQKVREALVKHDTGLHVLAASERPRDGLQINELAHFETILSRLKFLNRFIVVDLGSGLTPLSQKLAPLMSELLVVVEPAEASIGQAGEFLEDLLGLGIDKTRIAVLSNYRLRSETQLSVQQVQDRLKYPVTASFTPAPELMVQAARMKTSVIMLQESMTNQQYAGLAAKIEARAPKPNKPA